MQVSSLLTFAFLFGNSITLAIRVYRIDVRDPGIIKKCNGFSTTCNGGRAFERVTPIRQGYPDRFGATFPDYVHAYFYLLFYMPNETGWLYEFEMADEDVPLSFLNKEDYPIEYAYAPQPDLSQYTWLNVEAYQHYIRRNKVGRMVQVGHILPGLRKSIGKMCKGNTY